ncbi:MAG: NAD-dependent epimerase/dehydratase family protein [Spirochaetia bacterium]|nr:NAD-dependent epimerase/dehydratase family protein [Spirochaetia bacterium]
MKKKYLITGGAGFIGSHIAEELLINNHEVIVYDNFSTGKRENLEFEDVSNLKIIEADIRDYEKIEKACDSVDGIFHQAALVSVPLSFEKPAESFQINAAGTLNVLEAARKKKVKRILMASSAAVYGNNQNLPIKETEPIIPLSPYGLEKSIDESLCKFYHEVYGLEAIVLRYFNVFGCKQNPFSSYSGVISIFLNNLKNNKECVIFGDGAQSRDFIYVKDVAKANILAMNEKKINYGTYNVGTGIAVSINELFNTIKSIFKNEIHPRFEEPMFGDVKHSLADVTKIKNDLRFAFDYSLLEGLKKILS